MGSHREFANLRICFIKRDKRGRNYNKRQRCLAAVLDLIKDKDVHCTHFGTRTNVAGTCGYSSMTLVL